MFKILFEKNYNIHDVAILHMNASCTCTQRNTAVIMIGEGFVSKIHCHFRLSFNFCLIHSRWCSRHNWFMLNKICRNVISYTVMLICMSFISLGSVSK